MLVVDTGPLVAAADVADRDPEACLRLLGTAAGPLVVSPLVVAEAAYLIGRQLGPQLEAEFFRSISDGELVMETLTAGNSADHHVAPGDRWAWVTTPPYTFTGTTEAGADVVVAGRYPAEVEPDGAWNVVLVLQPGRNVASFAAVDSAGNETVREILVFYEIPMTELIVGFWIGEVAMPRGWQPIADFWVEFRADGSYSADAAGGEPPFSFGYPNDDYPEKVFGVEGHYPDGQPGSGWIAIVWDDEGFVTTTRGSLENISFSEGGDRLHFEFWATCGGRIGPFVYDLRRGSLPPQPTSTTTPTSEASTTTSLPPSSSTTPPPSTTSTSKATITTPMTPSTKPQP